MTIEEAKAALSAASAALNAIRNERASAVHAVENKYRPLISAAEREQYDAGQALRRAQSEAAPDHPLEGKTVYRIERKYQRWGSKHVDTKVAGVVFTYRPGVDLGPGYRRYTGVQIGEPMVRLLKKDGKPGAKCERYLSDFLSGKERQPRWFENPEDAVFTA